MYALSYGIFRSINWKYYTSLHKRRSLRNILLFGGLNEEMP